MGCHATAYPSPSIASLPTLPLKKRGRREEEEEEEEERAGDWTGQGLRKTTYDMPCLACFPTVPLLLLLFELSIPDLHSLGLPTTPLPDPHNSSYSLLPYPPLA